MNNLLILVHPESACGSAVFNIGKTEARLAREEMIIALDGHDGPVLILETGNPEEYDLDAAFGRAIDNIVERSVANGHFCRRIVAADDVVDDKDHFTNILEVMIPEISGTFDKIVSLCGAWRDDENGGCVDAVAEILTKAGARVDYLAVADINAGEEDFENEDYEDDELPAPAA